MFSSLPARCIILLEDIDAVGMERKSAESEEARDEQARQSMNRPRYPQCTLSGLLNVLDGVASQEGRIVLMTSNYAEKLDKALIRPGRIDKKIYLGNISQRSAELMFLRMYASDSASPVTFGLADGELEKLALQFSKALPDAVFTPAQMQGYLLMYRDNPAGAVGSVAAWSAEEMVKMEEAAKMHELMSAKKEKEARAKKLNGEPTSRELLNMIAAKNGILSSPSSEK